MTSQYPDKLSLYPARQHILLHSGGQDGVVCGHGHRKLGELCGDAGRHRPGGVVLLDVAQTTFKRIYRQHYFLHII